VRVSTRKLIYTKKTEKLLSKTTYVLPNAEQCQPKPTMTLTRVLYRTHSKAMFVIWAETQANDWTS